MRRWLFISLIAFALHLLAGSTRITTLAQEQPPRPRFQKGVTFYNSKAKAGYGSSSALTTMKRLNQLGVDTLTFIPFGFMKAVNSPIITYGNDPQAADEQLIKSIEDAKRLGFRVMLKPHLWIPRSWPGEIAMENDNDWKIWFEHYVRFIMHYARIAEKSGCEFFSLGNELRMATLREEWSQVIDAVRKIYRGKLLYASHWDGEHLWIPWQKLDIVGINFYFPLASRPDPPLLELLDSSMKIKTATEAFAKKIGRPVIFTEIGFRPVKETTMRPWESYEENPQSPIDLMAQLKAYLAIYLTFKDADWLHGIHWWLVDSDPQLGGPKDANYNFLGKPAEGIVSLWFKGQ